MINQYWANLTLKLTTDQKEKCQRQFPKFEGDVKNHIMFDTPEELL